MSKKAKQRTFGVSFKMTGDFTVDIAAASIEEAIARAKELGVGKALDLLGEGGWNDLSGHVSSAWEQT